VLFHSILIPLSLQVEPHDHALVEPMQQEENVQTSQNSIQNNEYETISQTCQTTTQTQFQKAQHQLLTQTHSKYPLQSETLLQSCQSQTPSQYHSQVQNSESQHSQNEPDLQNQSESNLELSADVQTHVLPHIISHQPMINFHRKPYEWKQLKCEICHEIWPVRQKTYHVTYRCFRCNRDKNEPKLYSSLNNAIPQSQPPCLQNLTQIEEMLIARVSPIMYIYKKQGGQRGYKGHISKYA
jgi:hypothetical protein